MKLIINYNIKNYNEKEFVEEKHWNIIKLCLKSTTAVDEEANNIFSIPILFFLI